MSKTRFIEQKEGHRAWVIFSNETEIKWLRLLKCGYRHCFVVMNDGKRWISFDPMAHHSEIIVHDISAEFDLPYWLERRGHSVVEAKLSPIRHRPAPISILNCVEAVKRVLGIHNLFILTPWQLSKYLQKQRRQKSNLTPEFQHLNKESHHGKHNIPA